MKFKIYSFGYFFGLMILFSAFFIKSNIINLLGLSYLSFGLGFLYSYYSEKRKENYQYYWWQDIFGINCIILFIYYQFRLTSYASGYVVSVVFLASIAIKYFYAKKVLRGAGNQNPRLPFRNMN